MDLFVGLQKSLVPDVITCSAPSVQAIKPSSLITSRAQFGRCSEKGELGLITYDAASSVCEKAKQPYKVIELLAEVQLTRHA